MEKQNVGTGVFSDGWTLSFGKIFFDIWPANRRASMCGDSMNFWGSKLYDSDLSYLLGQFLNIRNRE